jgi:hypothetical protein
MLRSAVKKKCPRCGLTKSADDFGHNRTLRDGLSCYCKACNRELGNAHYRRKREAAGFLVTKREALPPGIKRCARCHEIKLLGDFHRLRRQSGGYNPYCKECRRVMASDTHIKRNYGLSRGELDALIGSQGGLCAICGTNAAAQVDHDHVTGKIRGVLCFTCNVALGHLKDDVALFRKAIGYLEGTQ